MNTRDRGRWGEEIAAGYLRLWGYRIAGRNLRCGALEVDLVAVRGETVALVEVRLRSSVRHGRPEETVRRCKRQRLAAAAERLAAAGRLPPGRLRFDLIAIECLEARMELRHLAGLGGPSGSR
ncbi:MAG: YraN family protein [Candidatus Eisenbacteria bacterium]|uniref:UPF0102 protein FJY75_03140 n=1 Tax=Eiseniibacteriota bacterium TaxID=2212470 RepID=A0A937XAD6_UNCEI|nr:YraN family protein [Candidatus Eisenbacteria bacterium]